MHSLLRRQLKRHFGDGQGVPESLESFVRAIDEAYHQADEDRLMLERSLELSSKELLSANAALRTEKEQLDVTLHAIREGVITTDATGKVRLLNRVAQELSGWTEADAIGRPFEEVFPVRREGQDSPVDEWLESLRTGQATRPEVGRLKKPDGLALVVQCTAAPLFDRRGQVFGAVVVCRDLTDERKVEDEMVRSSRLESLGLLAGGIAHDFNNILTAILGNISLAQMQSRGQGQTAELLAESASAAERARDLTRQLLTFSKGGAPIKSTASIPELIDESARFALRGSNVRCEIEIASDLLPVEIDKGQISQVLNNLIINADQAMPSGGRLFISARNLLRDDFQGLGLSSPRNVWITVRDEGVGIPEEFLSKVFDPYFTTKQRGSGLGLATCYSVVTNHEGLLTVESKPGEGSRFHIVLPAAGIPAEERKKPDTVELVPGNGRILVMDDEESILRIVQGMLRFLGYRSETAVDGARALVAYRMAAEQGKPFDGVILDLTVPGGLGGAETAERLRALDPNVRLVASSGYSNDPILACYEEHGFHAVLTKPYNLKKLDKVLAGVLGSS